MVSRGLMLLAVAVAISGCGQYGSSGPDDLGLAAAVERQPMAVSMPNQAVINDKIERNKILSQWVLKSDFLCSDYELKLSRGIRDARLGTDAVATILTGLATIFVQPAVTRPLAGAATIALGVGSDVQTDLFMQQAGDVVATAIQTIRARARTELQNKWAASYEDYTLEQGLVDIERYDRETCNLNAALNEIRTSLNIAGPLAPQANNPIIPLPPKQPEGVSGAAPGAVAPAPQAIVTVPPSVQRTPNGQIVFTPGSVSTVPAVQPARLPPTPPPPPSKGVTPKGKLPPPPPLTDETAAARARARMQLIQALGQGPDGKGFDQARVTFMKQCWNELPKPVPTNFSLWLDSAGSETLASVTNCINRKSAPPESGSH